MENFLIQLKPYGLHTLIREKNPETLKMLDPFKYADDGDLLSMVNVINSKMDISFRNKSKRLFQVIEKVCSDYAPFARRIKLMDENDSSHYLLAHALIGERLKIGINGKVAKLEREWREMTRPLDQSFDDLVYVLENIDAELELCRGVGKTNSEKIERLMSLFHPADVQQYNMVISHSPNADQSFDVLTEAIRSNYSKLETLNLIVAASHANSMERRSGELLGPEIRRQN